MRIWPGTAGPLGAIWDGEGVNFFYLAQRFPTATDAQDYIDSNKLQDAYPWPVPKLTS